MRRVRIVVLSVVVVVLLSLLASCSQTVVPAYGVTVSPAELSAGLNDSVTSTLSLSSWNGFAGTLSLSVLDPSGHPARDIAVSPSTVTLAAGQKLTRTITVTPGSSVPAGTYDLAVGTSGVGAPRSGPFTLTLSSSATGTFKNAVSYSVANNAFSAAVGDLNGDGKLDLAVTHDTSPGSVSVLLGNGKGTFGSAASYAVGAYPFSVAVGDFNGDGKLDLAVANSGNTSTSIGTVSVLLGNGNGTFGNAVSYPVGWFPSSVVVGDFNGDGTPDLAVANVYSGTVSVLLGKGDGSFQSAVNYASGGSPFSLAVGDFNGDGKPDLVAGNQSVGAVSVLLGNGDGSFQSAVNYASNGRSTSVAVGDLNGDGKLDVVTGNYSGTVSVLLGNGDGSFETATSYPAGSSYSMSVVVGDFNGDGTPDLVTTSYLDGFVSVLLGNGDGTFPTTGGLTYATGSNPYSVAVGDFNSDSKLDLAVANTSNTSTYSGTVSVLLGQ
ncbi:MAG: VCBS repeat-containing protein [Deinococcales bacterium]